MISFCKWSRERFDMGSIKVLFAAVTRRWTYSNEATAGSNNVYCQTMGENVDLHCKMCPVRLEKEKTEHSYNLLFAREWAICRNQRIALFLMFPAWMYVFSWKNNNGESVLCEAISERMLYFEKRVLAILLVFN